MAKRWYYTFATFQGHTCEVDICDETFSGTAVELNKDVVGSPGCPSDNPVVIEEDNSDDLLDVVRIKTGYLNFVELTSGGLNDLFPKKNDSLEVFIFLDKPANVSYDAAAAEDYLIFHGYIQAQSFKNDYLGYRNSVKVPIQSVISVIGDDKIGTQETMLRKIFATDFTEYKYIVFPEMQYSTNPDISVDPIDIIEASFMKSILFPYNPDYNHGVMEYGETPDVYDPITKIQFIEAICHSMGLIAHEVGNMLVFTGGANATHRKYLVSNLGNTQYTYETITGSTLYLNTYFEFASKKNKYSYILPIENITCDWKEPDVPASIDFSICKLADTSASYLTLQYMGNQIVSSIWNNGRDAVANSIRLIGYADETQEVLEIRSNQQGLALFTLNFEVPYLHYQPSFVNNLHIELYGQTRTGTLEVAILSNGKWYNFDYDPQEDEEWVDYAVYKQLTPNGNAIDQTIATNGKTSTIYFRNATSYPLLYQVKSIQLDYVDSFKQFKLNPNNTRNKITNSSNSGSLREKTVNIDLWYYCDGYFSYSLPSTYYASQRILNLYLRKRTAISELTLLLSALAISGHDTQNRVISTRHNVREDIYELQIMSY